MDDTISMAKVLSLGRKKYHVSEKDIVDASKASIIRFEWNGEYYQDAYIASSLLIYHGEPLTSKISQKVINDSNTN